MNFSFCAIARNEEKTLPRMIESLKEFQSRGGIVVLVDTGSTDNTAALAREAGYIVEEVGDRFRSVVTKELADQINAQFIVENEGTCIKEGETYFDFASARNYAASLCPTDMVSSIDCDEVVSKINYEQIETYIHEGYTQFEYNFVFSHREDGSPAMEFTQSKFFDRRVIQWDGIVHEVLQGNGKIKYLDCFQLDHYQNFETNRHSYLTGLAVDCFLHPEKDRNSHYFARELLWNGQNMSALKEFQRHVTMNKWPAEKAQSLIFIGDIYGQLNDPVNQVAAYSSAFMIDSTRRAPLMKLAYFYKANNNHQAASCYATAALEIPWHGFYANHKEDYEDGPHAVLYWAKGWLGDIESAKHHLQKALSYQPNKKNYLEDRKYYFDTTLPTVSIVIPTLGRPEGLERCLASIKALEYPRDNIEILVFDGETLTVPEKVKLGVEKSTGEYICYAANDMEFAPDSLTIAVKHSLESQKSLVGFHSGQITDDKGNICEHFIIRKDFLPKLKNKEIFFTEMTHCGVDNFLWAQADKLDQAYHAEDAKITHHHFSKGAEYDAIYERGWNAVTRNKDLAILDRELALLNAL